VSISCRRPSPDLPSTRISSALKESSGDLPQLKDLFRELKAPDFDVLLGSANILTEGFRGGSSGAILAVASIAPNACVAAEDAWRHGNFERAETLQRQLATLGRQDRWRWRRTAQGRSRQGRSLRIPPRSPLPIPPRPRSSRSRPPSVKADSSRKVRMGRSGSKRKIATRCNTQPRVNLHND
jgi:hypothetical protein